MQSARYSIAEPRLFVLDEQKLVDYDGRLWDQALLVYFFALFVWAG